MVITQTTKSRRTREEMAEERLKIALRTLYKLQTTSGPIDDYSYFTRDHIYSQDIFPIKSKMRQEDLGRFLFKAERRGYLESVFVDSIHGFRIRPDQISEVEQLTGFKIDGRKPRTNYG